VSDLTAVLTAVLSALKYQLSGKVRRCSREQPIAAVAICFEKFNISQKSRSNRQERVNIPSAAHTGCFNSRRVRVTESERKREKERERERGGEEDNFSFPYFL